MSASIVRWGEIAWPGKNIQFDTVVNQWEINSITKAYCLPRITSPSSPYLAPPASNDCYHLNISSSHSCEFEKCPGRETWCTSCSTFYEIYLSFLPSLVVRSFIRCPLQISESRLMLMISLCKIEIESWSHLDGMCETIIVAYVVLSHFSGFSTFTTGGISFELHINVKDKICVLKGKVFFL